MGQTATIRTAVTGMLITAPKRCHVVKFLRDYDDFKGEAFIDMGGGDSNWNRKIRFYKWTWYPDEVKYRVHIPFQDKYSCYIPDEFYLPYIRKKGYFEIKHDMQDADVLARHNRQIFIDNMEILPMLDGQVDLKKYYIDKWLKEAERADEEKAISQAEYVLKKKRVKEKVDKLMSVNDSLEDAGM